MYCSISRSNALSVMPIIPLLFVRNLFITYFTTSMRLVVFLSVNKWNQEQIILYLNAFCHNITFKCAIDFEAKRGKSCGRHSCSAWSVLSSNWLTFLSAACPHNQKWSFTTWKVKLNSMSSFCYTSSNDQRGVSRQKNSRKQTTIAKGCLLQFYQAVNDHLWSQTCCDDENEQIGRQDWSAWATST